MTLHAPVAELETEDVPGPPGLPLGRRVELPGRGTTFVREVAGPEGAPTLLLLHGWIASSGLNWFQVFGPLSKHFRVVAPDMRGHGRGIRSGRRFRLADVAQDFAALCDELELESVIPVGYSLGGPVAQLLWKERPDLVEGMVLCATGQDIIPIFHQRVIYTSLMGVAASTTRLSQILTKLPRSWARRMFPQHTGGRPDSLRAWATAEMQRHSMRMIIEAGHASGTYRAGSWIHDVDVPAVALITTKDRAIGPILQARMALSIPTASMHRLEAGHMICASEDFAEPLVNACLEVRDRIWAERRAS